ncbi:MAG: hypothetical protein PHX20_03925 [Candidatus Omnitrophica bacterium]|nr:hypothetical protein [Candidatus Omnitrophota bacterium]MDD5436673.1 hypothetical protein [Candidatus Omnitrophota bacterium]
MMKGVGMLSVIPTSVLLTISFFVLLALKKVETQSLKIFGYCIAVLLWISAAIAFTSLSCCPMMSHKGMGKPMHGKMMQGKMMCAPGCGAMMQGASEEEEMGEMAHSGEMMPEREPES